MLTVPPITFSAAAAKESEHQFYPSNRVQSNIDVGISSIQATFFILASPAAQLRASRRPRSSSEAHRWGVTSRPSDEQQCCSDAQARSRDGNQRVLIINVGRGQEMSRTWRRVTLHGWKQADVM